MEMNPRDLSEVDWNAVPHADWNAKSGHKCQINFYSLVKGVPGGKQMRLSGAPSCRKRNLTRSS